MNALEKAKAKILHAIDAQVEPLSRDDFRELLIWVALEANCRLDCMREEDGVE